MCFFHKWSKWMQYSVYLKERRITDRWALAAAIQNRQRKTCIKCGKVKDESINMTVV